MKNLKLTVLALLSVFFVSAVSAQNPHFVESPTKTDNGATLTFCGKVAGLGNKAVEITVYATATVTTQCTNPAGQVAPGQTRTVTTTKKISVMPENGHVDFCLTTDQLAPGSCPNGKWTGKVLDASFDNVYITVNGKRIYE